MEQSPNNVSVGLYVSHTHYRTKSHTLLNDVLFKINCIMDVFNRIFRLNSKPPCFGTPHSNVAAKFTDTTNVEHQWANVETNIGDTVGNVTLKTAANQAYQEHKTAEIPTNATPIKEKTLHTKELVIRKATQLPEDLPDDEYLENGEIGKLSYFLNQIYKRRLKEIDTTADGDKELRLATYEEWTMMLIKMNESILRNTVDLELDVIKILDGNMKHTSKLHMKDDNKMKYKYRRDIVKLLKIYSHARKTGEWNFNVNFETINSEKILGRNGSIHKK